MKLRLLKNVCVCVCVCARARMHARMLSCSTMSDSAMPWTAALRAPLSMGFFRQEYSCGLPFSPPGDLPNPGTEPTSPVYPVLEGRFFIPEPSGKLLKYRCTTKIHYSVLHIHFILRLFFV